MNRRTFLALSAASLLAACSPPAPEPDGVLLSLATHAREDAAALAQVRDDLAATRQRHSQLLLAEVSRLCGHFEDGSTPASCTPNLTSPPSTTPSAEIGEVNVMEMLAASLTETDAALQSIPAESAIVVARIHTELAIIVSSAPTLGAVVPATADIEGAKQALEWEYGTIYGLEVHAAFNPEELEAALDKALELHRDIATTLRSGLATAHATEIPVMAAAYTVPGVEQQDFYAAVASQSVLAWHDCATRAADSAWRTYAIRAASAIAVQAIPGLEFAGIQPWRADFLHINSSNL